MTEQPDTPTSFNDHGKAGGGHATGAIVTERQRCVCREVCLEHCRACNHPGRNPEDMCIVGPEAPGPRVVVSADQPLTSDELATIKARATLAEPAGEWTVEPNGLGHWDVWTGRGGDEQCLAQAIQGHDTADHIAGMDPTTTLRLVAEVERLQGEVASLPQTTASGKPGPVEGPRVCPSCGANNGEHGLVDGELCPAMHVEHPLRRQQAPLWMRRTGGSS